MFVLRYFFFNYVDLFVLDKFLVMVSTYLLRLEKIDLEVYFKFLSVPNVREWDTGLGFQVLQLFCLLEFITQQKPLFSLSHLSGVFLLQDLNTIVSESKVNIFYVLKCNLKNKQLLSFLYSFIVIFKSCLFQTCNSLSVCLLKNNNSIHIQKKTLSLLTVTNYFITNDIKKSLFCTFSFNKRIYLNKFLLNILDIL